MAGLNRPDMTLTPDDFIMIKANWEPKSQNIADIAHTLSLGADSFVFADDNPAEREIVRQHLPGTAVPDIGDRPEYYIRAIDRMGYFEVTSVSADDAERNRMYKQNAERSRAETSFSDYGDYLRSLEMKAEIRGFVPMYISRISQLTNKSNQFNLTTRRYTQEDITAFAEDDNYITLYGKLTDKFGDNGVVSVVIAKQNGSCADITLWLMSCRVLKRNMEHAMLDELVRLSEERGISVLKGYYFPTAKNAMVKDFYKTMGFEKLSEDENGSTEWQFVIPGNYTNKQDVIEVI
jgi:FkbH-like protein